MAMFKRTFARTIPDNLRAPHMKLWDFEAKRARKFTRTSPRTLPWNFITMLCDRGWSNLADPAVTKPGLGEHSVGFS